MNEPNFIIEHRIKFEDSTIRARLAAVETALSKLIPLIPKVETMATQIETLNTEQDETDVKAQAALDSSVAVGEAVTDLRNLVLELQGQVGNVITQAQFDAWKARSDAAQVKMDNAIVNLTSAINPPPPAG